MFDTGAVGDPNHQVHDWEPGIAPSGLFWTIPISPSVIEIDPGSGQARMVAENVAVTDYHDFIRKLDMIHPRYGQQMLMQYEPDTDTGKGI